MNKRELMEEMRLRTGATNEELLFILDVFEEVVTEALGRGDEVWLPGFGRFYVRDRPELAGTHSQTGEAMVVPAGKVPAFRPGKQLKASVETVA